MKSAAFLTAVMLSGCSLTFNANKLPENNTTVAEPSGEGVKGKEELFVKYGDFRKEYLYWLKCKGITDDSDETYASSCEAQREQIISYLINEKIINDKAKELGADVFTDEEISALEEDFDAQIQEQIDYFAGIADYGTLATGESVSEEEKQKRGGEMLDAFLEDCELTRDDLFMWQKSDLLRQKVQKEVTKDVASDYSEAEKTFNNYVESIKNLYANDQREYESGQYSAFWIPEGSRRIKHILLKFDDSVTDEITALREEGDEEGADKLREEKLDEMLDDVNKIKNMIDNGSNFDELIKEYSADAAGSSMYPNGYLVVPDSVTYVPEFTAAAFELENIGDYKPAASDYGWHIILYASDAVVTDEEIKSYVDYIHETLTANAVNEKFAEVLNGWKEDYDYTIDYEILKIDPLSETLEGTKAS